jgi:hypothetical protein
MKPVDTRTKGTERAEPIGRRVDEPEENRKERVGRIDKQTWVQERRDPTAQPKLHAQFNISTVSGGYR